MSQTKNLDLFFTELDLAQIVSQYDRIEQQIEQQSFTAALELIAPERYYRGDQKFEIDGQVHFFRFSTKDRCARLHLAPHEPTRSKFVVLSDDFSTAGWISRIEVRLPNRIRRIGERALQEMTRSFRMKYQLLENALVHQYRKHQNGLFEGIDVLFDALLKVNELNIPGGKMNFTVTSTKSRRFHHHLSAENVRDILERFKRVDDMPFSPLKGVIILINEDCVDSFLSRGVLSENTFRSLPFASISLTGNNPKVHAAEQRAYGSENIAVMEVCRVHGLSLQLNCAPQFVKLLKPLILKNRTVIRERFQQNVEGFSRRADAIRAFMLKKPGSWGQAGQFLLGSVERVLGHALAQKLPG